MPPLRGPEWIDPIEMHQFHLSGLEYDLWKELRDYFTSKHTKKNNNKTDRNQLESGYSFWIYAK